MIEGSGGFHRKGFLPPRRALPLSPLCCPGLAARVEIASQPKNNNNKQTNNNNNNNNERRNAINQRRRDDDDRAACPCL